MVKSIIVLTVVTCLSTMMVSNDVYARDAIPVKEAGPYSSKTPKYHFAITRAEQEKQLKNNPLMKRFAESRKQQASDPYRPAYHFVSPEGLMNDALELLFWQGEWHMFYAAHPPDWAPKQGPQHWGHAISKDLVHWRDLPYAIYPGIEAHSFDGGAVVEKGRVTVFYTGPGAPGPEAPWAPGYTRGQLAATSTDPLLLNWKKSAPLVSITDIPGDSDIWKEGDTYYGMIGSKYAYYPESKVPPRSFGMNKMHNTPASWPKTALWTSKDLKNWTPQGNLLFENTPLTDRFDDLACPTFLEIEDKHLLLYFSHIHGGKYLLGDYDKKTHKFRPYDRGNFNHGQVFPGGAHCSAGSVDGKGGVMNIMNINEAMKDSWGRPMSLPQHLTLSDDKRLRITPADSVKSLRGAHQTLAETVLPAGTEVIIKGVEGDTMELELEIDPKQSRFVQLNILRSPNAEEQTSIIFYNLHTPKGLYLKGRITEEVVLDTSRSSILPGVYPRSPEKAPINIGTENLKLRVFIDRSIIEVFVNGQQYLAGRAYPGRKDSLGVSLQAFGQNAVLKKLDAWKMKAIWPIIESK